jgi:MSHA biogenesis protein MshN
MSVINQVLLELEKRRASAMERGTLPSHVRALPEEERSLSWGWIAAGGLVAVGAVAAWGLLLSGIDLTRHRIAAPVADPRGSERVVARVAAAPAAVTTDVRPRGEGNGDAPPEGPASRLSLELSNVPAAAQGPTSSSPVSPAEPAASKPLPASRVLARAAADGAAPAPAPATHAESARSPAVVASAKAPAAPRPDAKFSRSAPAPAAGGPQIQKQERQPTPRELSDNEYRRATASLHQGRSGEAEEGFQAALNLYPAHHGARQGLVGLLVGSKRFAEAERVLQEGVKLAPSQTGFAMTLARLQVDRGDNALATATLQKGLEHAQGNPDYQAFLATLLQRQSRHEEAIEQFQAALRLRPAVGVWWLGLGISLQSANRTADAQEAYRRARATNSLSPDLAAFAEQRMRQLQ